MSKLDDIIKGFNKEQKGSIINQGLTTQQIQRIPMSSPRLNYMLYGGLPRGRLIEFFGEESGGKTTTALDAVANAQRLFIEEYATEVEQLSSIENPKAVEKERLKYLESRGPQRVFWLDCENTLDKDWAIKLGVNIDDLIVAKPDNQYAEELFELVDSMINTDEIGLVVIDSFAAMMSKQEYEKSIEDRTFAGISGPLTVFSRKAVQGCQRTKCTLIGINQLREDINNPYNMDKTPGGRAWKFNCTLRLRFGKGPLIDAKGNEIKRSSETAAGNIVNINMVKNKFCTPDRRVGFYTLNYTYGIDVIADLIEVAQRHGIVEQAGSWFTLFDPRGAEPTPIMDNETNAQVKAQGKTGLVALVEESAELYDLIKEIIDDVEKGS